MNKTRNVVRRWLAFVLTVGVLAGSVPASSVYAEVQNTNVNRTQNTADTDTASTKTTAGITAVDTTTVDTTTANGTEVSETVDESISEEQTEEIPKIQVEGVFSNCAITSDKQNILIEFSSTGQIEGTDGNVYLLELQPYEDSVEGRTDYLIAKSIGESATVQIPLNYSSNKDRLYNKFLLAVWDGENYVPVSSFRYISNPEVVASNQKEFKEPLTKKGLNIEISMLKDAFDLGVKHVATNIAFSHIIGTGIEYEYNGKTYHFNKQVMDEYDKTISALSNKDISVTAILLNDWNSATPDLVHPGVKKTSSANYYMFNASTKEGYEQTRAIMSFLAEHYDGSNPDAGKVSNWIIGNEINNQLWNYIGKMDVNQYVREYQRAFRVMYTAIKSVSANDRVYFSLDYYWNDPANKDNQLKYGGKEIVDTFNAMVLSEGQMDWGLAYHPYPIPLTEPEFWDDASTGLITNDANSPVINFANLSVLTDYFCQDSMKNAEGEVRHIILTEEGFTSMSATRGNVEDLQAAAIAYSYYMVDSNPYIDAYILSRQVDAPSEAQASLNFGLWYSDSSQKDRIVATTQKRSWRVFLNVDNKRYTLDNTAFAKEILGIEKWSDVIPNFRWRSLEK